MAVRVQIIKRQRDARKTRVAAYCRVSTNQEAQEDSYETQISAYTRKIQANKEWDFAGIYADRGITGTDARIRAGFQRMIDDALGGKIDMILCKTVSRFSRNVVDCQDTLRLLKENRVDVYFEEEGVSTAEPSTSLMLAFRAAIAQGESESISRNRLWANRARVLRGQYTAGNNMVLGYDARCGKFAPNAAAWVVERIFTFYGEGMRVSDIARRVNGLGGRTLRGRPFTSSAIMGIVRNEVYVGDRRLQKSAPRALFKNEDEPKDYATNYLADDHPAIISRELWEKAQTRLKERQRQREAGVRTDPAGHHVFYGKVFCGVCGSAFIRRTGRGGASKYWICRGRLKGRGPEKCGAPIWKEERLLAEIAARDIDVGGFSKITVFKDRIAFE